ncbi:hypothetical protein ACFL1H_01750 [Nanoarchaeota archaeon]
MEENYKEKVKRFISEGNIIQYYRQVLDKDLDLNYATTVRGKIFHNNAILHGAIKLDDESGDLKLEIDFRESFEKYGLQKTIDNLVTFKKRKDRLSEKGIEGQYDQNQKGPSVHYEFIINEEEELMEILKTFNEVCQESQQKKTGFIYLGQNLDTINCYIAGLFPTLCVSSYSLEINSLNEKDSISEIMGNRILNTISKSPTTEYKIINGISIDLPDSERNKPRIVFEIEFEDLLQSDEIVDEKEVEGIDKFLRNSEYFQGKLDDRQRVFTYKDPKDEDRMFQFLYVD